MDKLRQELSSLRVERVLDVATRDGAFAKEMYKGFAGCGEIVALDLSEKMFEKGREKCAGMPVRFALGDACHMDFEDNTFDVVGIGNSLHHIPDLAALLSEMKRVVKSGGLILLSEMYNFRGHLTKENANFEEAAKCALKVIDSKYFALNTSRFGASKNEKGDAFSDMFQENNQNRTSGNTESIWVMQFEYQTVGGGTNSDDWTRRAWNPQYFAINGFALADSLGGRGLAQISPMKWWIGTKNTSATQVAGAKEGGIFEDGDMRNSKYNIKRDWYYNNPLVPASLGKKSEITDKTWSTGQLFPALTKFFFGKSDNLQLSGSYKDRMKCRLGETYLHLAEAYLGMGDAAKAAEALNVIRKRAKVRNLEASEVTVDELLDERIREMVGEESRKFTLVRMGADVYVNRVKKYNPSIADQIDEHFALWPVPQEIRDANRGSEFPQNPGYGE